MSIIDKITSLEDKRDRRKDKLKKRREKRDQEKYNHRQEEYDMIYRNEKQKSDFKSLLSRLKFETYTKRLVGIVTFIAIADLQLSYILAFMGKDQIAESLSIQVCTTLLGTITVYIIRAHFDTKAEKRDELIKSGYIVPKDSSVISDEVIKNKLQELINNSGLSEHISTESNSELETENPDDSDACG